MTTPPPVEPLSPELIAYLTTHATTTVTENRAVRDALLSVHAVATRGHQLALTLRSDLNEAEYAVHNTAVDHRLNFMHTRIDEVDVAARDLEIAMKRLARATQALEDGHATDPDELARLVAAHQSIP